MSGPFIAVDWGTTNRRAWLVEDGCTVTVARPGPGVTAVPAHGFAGEAAAIRAELGDHPMLLAGMVGSSIGWRVAPYVPAPADAAGLAAGLVLIDDRTAIVPGVSTAADGRADVMRGEEVQLIGAVAAGFAPADALLVQPGTHCKWVRMVGGRVAGFTTAMTGEVFALLRIHSILAPQLAGPVMPDDAFLAGVAEARQGDLLVSLFGVRAAALLGARDNADAASFASGLLIGSDVAAALARHHDAAIHLLADAALGALYTAAIEAHGRVVHRVDSEAAFLAGTSRIRTLA